MHETFFIKQNGEVTNWKTVIKHFDSLEDGRYKMRTDKSSKRTLMQNNWFHAILPDIMKGLQEVGYYDLNLSKTKAFVKEMFFKVPISNGLETHEIIEDTSETSKEDFTLRAEKIIVWAQEYLGIDIAPPGKQIEMYE
jgi:hypothetical protein